MDSENRDLKDYGTALQEALKADLKANGIGKYAYKPWMPCGAAWSVGQHLFSMWVFQCLPGDNAKRCYVGGFKGSRTDFKSPLTVLEHLHIWRGFHVAINLFPRKWDLPKDEEERYRGIVEDAGAMRPELYKLPSLEDQAMTVPALVENSVFHWDHTYQQHCELTSFTPGIDLEFGTWKHTAEAFFLPHLMSDEQVSVLTEQV